MCPKRKGGKAPPRLPRQSQTPCVAELGSAGAFRCSFLLDSSPGRATSAANAITEFVTLDSAFGGVEVSEEEHANSSGHGEDEISESEQMQQTAAGTEGDTNSECGRFPQFSVTAGPAGTLRMLLCFFYEQLLTRGFTHDRAADLLLQNTKAMLQGIHAERRGTRAAERIVASVRSEEWQRSYGEPMLYPWTDSEDSDFVSETSHESGESIEESTYADDETSSKRSQEDAEDEGTFSPVPDTETIDVRILSLFLSDVIRRQREAAKFGNLQRLMHVFQSSSLGFLSRNDERRLAQTCAAGFTSLTEKWFREVVQGTAMSTENGTAG